MRKAMVVALALALLAGCGDEDAVQDKQEDDAKDVAMVERMSKPPFRPIKPQPFSDDDLDRSDLRRGGCMFRPGTGGREAPLFVTQADRGYIKIAGRVQPLAAKGGSAELPSGAHSTYIGMDSWIELVAQAGDDATDPPGGDAWPSRLVIHDADERVAFDSLGEVICSGE